MITGDNMGSGYLSPGSPTQHVLELKQYIVNNSYVKSAVILYEGFLFWKYGKELKEELIMSVLDILNKIETNKWIAIYTGEPNNVVLARQVYNDFTMIFMTDDDSSKALKKIIDDVLLGKIPRCNNCGTDLYKAGTKCPSCNRVIISGTACPYCGYSGARKRPSCGSDILPSGEVVSSRIRKDIIIGWSSYWYRSSIDTASSKPCMVDYCYRLYSWRRNNTKITLG